MNRDRVVLKESERAHYEERAAIHEFSGNEPRHVAEREAMAEVLDARRLALKAK